MSSERNLEGVEMPDPPDNSGLRYYAQLRESILRLGWPADGQFAYLVENGYPTCELHNAFFDFVPGGLGFLRERGRISNNDEELLRSFERFLLTIVNGG